MYCTKCGAKLEPNERFCPFCGQAVEDTPIQSAAPSPTPSPAPKSPPPQPSIPDPGKKPMDKKFIVVVAAIAVAVVAIIAAILLLGGNEKPDDTAVSPSPDLSLGPSKEPTESTLPSQPLETEEPTQASVSLSDLYIGAWVAEGCTIDDDTNGWMALYIESVHGNAMTFTLEKVQSGPSNRIATTYPITVTIENGQGSFPVNDSWGNSGTGVITVKGDVIHVTVDITSPDMTAMWDITMDADFYPDQITIMTDEGKLSLHQNPYVDDGQVVIPMEPVFDALGITVFEDEYALVGMTEHEAITLTQRDEDYFELEIGSIGLDWERSELIHFSEDCHYIPLDTLDVFGLQVKWEPSEKLITIQGTIAVKDRVNAEKVEALKGFDIDAAGQRIQNAGYSFAAAGAYNGYWGGARYWAIPVQTADGVQYAIVSYDGATYQMIVEPAEY